MADDARAATPPPSASDCASCICAPRGRAIPDARRAAWTIISSNALATFASK
jgi:hypothetical protein